VDIARESEASLIGRLQKPMDKSDHEQAFGEIREACQKKLLGFIAVRSRAGDDPEDFAQEVWRRFYVASAQVDPARAPIMAYLRTIASHVMAEFYRERDARERVIMLQEDLLARLNRYPDLIDHTDLRDSLPGQTEHPGEQTIEEILAECERYQKLLRLTFAGDSPPHQLIVFGFVNLLSWKLREVVGELSDQRLQILESQLEEEYRIGALPQIDIRSAFERLRTTMHLRLSEVVHERRTLEAHDSLLDKIVGATILQEYYTTPSPAADIAHWCETVKVKVLKALRQNGNVSALQERGHV